MKFKDLKNKKNNKRNGKKDKKLESIYSIKYLMIDKEKLNNIIKLNNSKIDKNNKIDFKSKKESDNINLSNKWDEKLTLKDQKFNKLNFSNKLLKNNKEED